jgi:hypothetical protein
MCSQIRSGYNFPNVSVNYRYGLEESAPIPDFSQPVNQKQIDFTLMGKTLNGYDFGSTRTVVEPLFEEFEQIELINSGIYSGFDTSTTSYVQTTNILRLTGLNVINIGDGYTTGDHPLELTFSNLDDPRVSGGNGQIYDQPILDIVTVDGGGLGSFSIIDGGRFQGSYIVNAYSGSEIDFSRTGTGFFGTQLSTPPGGWDYNTGVYTGTGTLIYNETIDSVDMGQITGTGSFSGNVFDAGGGNNVFNGIFTSASASIGVAFNTVDDDEFIFNETGVLFNTGSLFFAETGVEPTYIVNSSNPANIENQDDIRAGTNYSNWNSLLEDPIDRQAYTHVVRDSDVDSVSSILNIKRLNDTLHKAEQEIKVTEKPGLFGGDLKVDAAFRIGNPTDSFVTIKYEWGFLGTDFFSVGSSTYSGQTIGGYLVKGPNLFFGSWKSLQASDPKYSDLTIAQLKSSFPKYIRVSKDMYEVGSSLISRDVILDSINEQFNTTYSYPSSALVATKLNSTYFDNIPTRTYDAKLKKVWVPETYNIEHFVEDKRFRKSEINPNPQVGVFNPTRVYNRFSKRPSGENDLFGDTIAINKGTLFICDPDWGQASSVSYAFNNYGQIFVYKNMGRDLNHDSSNDFQMIRDGIPRNSALNSISSGYTFSLPDFDITSGNSEGPFGLNYLQSSSRILFTTTIALIGFIKLSSGYAGFPMSATHSLFLRVSPKKSAILRASVSHQEAPYGEYRALMNQVAGVVIGTVTSPNQATPTTVLRVVNYNGINSALDETSVYNSSETDYIWVKFFSAQIRQIVIKRIVISYGVIEYAYLGGSIAPVYSSLGGHPYRITMNSVTLTDQTMKDYFFPFEPKVSETQGEYLIHSVVKNENATLAQSQDALLIFKLRDNGFWYPLQDIRKFNSGGSDEEPISVSFFPSENRFVVIWDNISEIEIYALNNNSGLFSLEYSIPNFLGIFEGFEVYDLRSNAHGYCSTINSDTLAVSRRCSVRETAITENQLRDDTILTNIFIYKRDSLDEWALSEIVFPPEFKIELTISGGPNIKTSGEWLIASGIYYDGDPYSQNRDVGVVLLYRYNGKKYEFIKKFSSETIKDLDADGNPDFSNYNTYFGDYIALDLDINNEPVIITSASRQEHSSPNTEGYIYVFKKNPYSDEWIYEKHNSFTGWEVNEDTHIGVPHLAFDGKNAAFILEGHSILPDSVGTFSIGESDKSTRLLANKNWFGIMKKGWSDNPAWIIYDLLTNPIYGAGAALDDLKDINVFNFFEVSKYFDSSDADGYYLPLYDERGRTEPRLSCNFLLDSDFNAFDVISSICDIFFGAVYIKEGKYNIWADRPTETSWYFNNHDVLDGNFSYTDAPKSTRVNMIRVPYLDKYENFNPKVEFIEDSDLMRKNGKNEVELDFATFTTRSQARRFGKQYLYNKSYETERIKFLTDSKALFLNPGDVIGVNDKLKSFKNEKLFWKVSKLRHEEKVYAVNHTKNDQVFDTFTFSEITFRKSDTENYEVKHIDKESSSSFSFSHLDLSLDNSGVPYVFGSMSNGDCAVYKKNGNDFDEVFFEEGTSYALTSDFRSNLAFDDSNTPYFSLIEGGSSEPTIGFLKFTGNNFTNTGDWQFTQLENLDASSGNFIPQVDFKSVIRINSNNDKYILTYRTDSSPQSGEYLLYHCDGGLDETNPSLWNRYVIDSFGDYQTQVDFDMQLTNDKPAIAYSTPIDQFGNFYQIRYKELTGTSLGLESHWGDVFVQGKSKNVNSDTFSLKFDTSGIPYIPHNWDAEDGRFMNSPLSYSGRFSYDNWSDNSQFINYRDTVLHKMSLEFLQNGNALIFSSNYRLQTDKFTPSDSLRRSFQFEESFDNKEWGQYHNWNKQTIYDTTLTYGTSYQANLPSTAYSFSGCVITLENEDAFLYDIDFDIDTSIENNLEVTKLFAGDVSDLYKETQFKNFSSKITEAANTESSYLTITGFETSGSYINLFAEESMANSKKIKELFVDNPMVRPIVNREDRYKEFRVLNIQEKEHNLYEIEAKEYSSGKFDIIDNYASIVEPEQPEYNIGLPNNEVIRPPAPVGVQFITGIDDAGSPFLTGMVTGEPNGSETEYRLSLTYPNGKTIQKEIEKNTDTLSPSNEPLTNFGFYNLAGAGNYELNVKSLKNPESSTFTSKKFSISELKEKVSIYPFISDVNLSVQEELLRVNIKPKNVYGEILNLFDSNCRINLIVGGEIYVENSKMTDFEISFQQIKDLTNSNVREKEIKAELTYDTSVVSEKSKILKDEAPRINNINFVSDGSSASIVAEILESEKLTSVDIRTGETIIKTFGIENQNRLQNFRLEDFEVSALPKNQKINFTFTPKDFYGTGESYNCEGFIPEKETVFDKYNNSMISIYSIYSEDVISTGFSSYSSSNNQSGFYGNGQDCLIELSSSLLSGQPASLNLELISDTQTDPLCIKFNDEGFLSSKKVVSLSNKYYNVKVFGESGLFDGFDLKIKKLV